LFSQTEVIRERALRSVFHARPGITGLAQINNIDMSTPKLLAETEARMLQELTISAYLKYIFLTVGGKGTGDAIKTE
jgi:lipopolysaccharide/colanic/teichoic acid biosynthesis glycosyltransferase